MLSKDVIDIFGILEVHLTKQNTCNVKCRTLCRYFVPFQLFFKILPMLSQVKRDLRSAEVRELVNFSEKCDLKINTPLWNPVCENVRRAKWAKISNKCKDSKNVSNKLLWIAIAWPAIAKSFCSYMLIKVVFNPSCPVYISQQVLDSRVLA